MWFRKKGTGGLIHQLCVCVCVCGGGGSAFISASIVVLLCIFRLNDTTDIDMVEVDFMEQR